MTAILDANGGDLDAVRAEIARSTSRQLEDRYGVHRSSVKYWRKIYGASPLPQSRGLIFDPPPNADRLWKRTPGRLSYYVQNNNWSA